MTDDIINSVFDILEYESLEIVVLLVLEVPGSVLLVPLSCFPNIIW